MRIPSTEVSKREMTAFYERFIRFGGSAARFKKLMEDDELMKWWMERFAERFIVHDVFSRVDTVLASFKERCAMKGIEWNRFVWCGSETPPDFDPNDDQTVVVLEATLDTLQHTFDFSFEWLVDQHPDWRGMLSMNSDSRHLSLVNPEPYRPPPHHRAKEPPAIIRPVSKFSPYTLRWVRMQLNANAGKLISRMPSREHAPGCAVLFMAAEHPTWVRDVAHPKRLGLWLPGLHGYGQSRSSSDVPCLRFAYGQADIKLYLKSPVTRHPNLLIPAFLP